MRKLIWIEGRFSDVCLAIAGAMLALVMLLTSYQIFQRFVMGDPSSWSEPAARMALVWAVFMALPAVFRRGLMIAIDALLNVVPHQTKRALHIVVGLASVAFLMILITAGVSMARLALHQNIAGLNISMAFMYGAIPVGAAATLPAVLVRTVRLFIDPNLQEKERTQNLEAAQ